MDRPSRRGSIIRLLLRKLSLELGDVLQTLRDQRAKLAAAEQQFQNADDEYQAALRAAHAQLVPGRELDIAAQATTGRDLMFRLRHLAEKRAAMTRFSDALNATRKDVEQRRTQIRKLEQVEERERHVQRQGVGTIQANEDDATWLGSVQARPQT